MFGGFLSYEISPAIIAKYDQQTAQISETLDQIIEAYREARDEAGAVASSLTLALSLMAAGEAWQNDLLTVAIGRLAEL